MFWRGFLDSDPRITFTTAAATARKKILPQTPLSSFFESLNFVFKVVGLSPGLGMKGYERECL